MYFMPDDIPIRVVLKTGLKGLLYDWLALDHRNQIPHFVFAQRPHFILISSLPLWSIWP